MLCFCFLHLVYPMLPVSLGCVVFLFCFLHLVYPMLPVSLGCAVFLFSSSCVPYVASFSRLCCVFVSLHLVYPMLPVFLDFLFVLSLRYSLTFFIEYCVDDWLLSFIRMHGSLKITWLGCRYNHDFRFDKNWCTVFGEYHTSITFNIFAALNEHVT